MFKFLRYIFLDKLVSIFLLFVIGCSEVQDSRNEVLVVGTSADNPPYEFIQNSQIVGFDIDLMKEIAKSFDMKLVFKDIDFSGLITSLVSKKVDLVIAGLSVTKERKKRVDFSIPYLETVPVLIFKKRSGYSSVADLGDKIISVQLGTIFANIARNITKRYKSHVDFFGNNLLSIQALLRDKTNAIILEQSQAEVFIDTHPELTYFILNEAKTKFSIAMRKKYPFRIMIDDAINHLQKNGTIDKLLKKWNIYQ
ncbi:ABC transporter substrate-binding protein [Rickettsia endosymbiont of Cardiosporidium cionae]|uniref:ABC transporter substrate-binding protein n=1 Tax=Rickettsia endosymbiont of Cardiosporidium cionae TaxID=2777155 RepID=UPI0018951DDA|nr:ABC transporter substrate-binding protein [Rickettsia endosymbiont of Cardiosporidium cionae]KAF8818954.1 amino acid ABC transporter substrate-binding protein [Rickettsia endosymbiont of Cardiosporidium cionae]